jgi:hypothetical protein
MKKIFVAICCAVTLLTACKKDAGAGGNSSIKGHVNIDYRITLENSNTYTNTVNGGDRDVYIVYGEHISPDDRAWTNKDGDFEFKYLRPGKYTLYTYSQDTTSTAVTWDENKLAVLKTVEIQDHNEQIDAGIFTVYAKK